MIKNLIVADRQTGKTRHLITKCSQDEYSLIVCPTRMMCNYVFKEARNMGLEIPMPITFSDFVAGKFYPKNVNNFYFDELQISLEAIANGVPIDTAIIGFNENSNLYAVGDSVNRKREVKDKMSKVIIISSLSQENEIKKVSDYYKKLGYIVDYPIKQSDKEFGRIVEDYLYRISIADIVVAITKSDGTFGTGVTYELAFARYLNKRIVIITDLDGGNV